MDFTVHTDKGNYTVTAKDPGDARAIVKKCCPLAIIKKIKLTGGQQRESKPAKKD